MSEFWSHSVFGFLGKTKISERNLLSNALKVRTCCIKGAKKKKTQTFHKSTSSNHSLTISAQQSGTPKYSSVSVSTKKKLSKIPKHFIREMLLPVVRRRIVPRQKFVGVENEAESKVGKSVLEG